MSILCVRALVKHCPFQFIDMSLLIDNVSCCIDIADLFVGFVHLSLQVGMV